MAIQITIIRAGSTKELVEKVNTFLAKATQDARNVLEVIACFPDVDDYVAVVQRNAPHLRTFEDEG